VLKNKLFNSYTFLYRQLFEFIYDKLGQETLIKWFVEYSVRYGKDFFKSRYKMDSFGEFDQEFQALAAHLQAGRKIVLKK
jgi:hypothetical protein